MRRKLRLKQDFHALKVNIQLTFHTYIVVLEDTIDTTKPLNKSYRIGVTLNATVVRTT
jgi:hypothetical protein